VSLAAFRRRTAEPEAVAVDTLAPLRARVDDLTARSKTVSGRLAEIDAREATLRASLDAAVNEGRDADNEAAALAELPRERAALAAQASAVSRAETEARAAVAAEEARLHELEVDAQIAELRSGAEAAEAAFREALVDVGKRYEELLAAESGLGSALSEGKRPSGRGFRDGAARAIEEAEAEARRRAQEAIGRGAAGPSTHLGEGPRVPYAVFSRW
jgi:chromosome segregation ATPase